MMSEKESNNVFKLVLKQEDVLLCETSFNADEFNPFTRYSINIREELPLIINKLQKVLSKRRYSVECNVGKNNPNDDDVVYNLYRYVNNLINAYPKSWKNSLVYSPENKEQKFDELVIRGVECKIGLYINDNPIVERDFYVNGFNPVSRWSLDVLHVMYDITDIIYNQIKNNDIKNIWDDYDLIKYKGLNITKIRELSIGERNRMLRSIGRV